MEELFSLLESALTQQHNLWMFYTLVVSSAFGAAFTNAYRSFTILPRLIMTTVVAVAVWYNFYMLVSNMLLINELVEMIRSNLTTDSDLYRIFNSTYYHRYNPPPDTFVYYVYGTINVGLLFAMWWSECCNIYRRTTNRIFNRH